MFIVGAFGTSLIAGWLPIISQLKTSAWHLFSNYSLSVIPLFLLMGNFAGKAGMSEALFKFTGACLGHRKGGVAMAAIGACAGFGAICGSSLATAATMGKVALPELRRLGYSGALSTGTLAAGGTLGILIPPSVILVIYGLLTEQSIGKLFMAGFIPGFIGIVFYTLAVKFVVARDASLGPAGERTEWKERLLALKDVWTTLALFIFVIGGIYIGLFSATEAAGMGAAGALLITFLKGALSRKILMDVGREAALLTAKLFALLFGASMFSNFLNRAGLPDALMGVINSFELSGLAVIFIILLIYVLLGCVFESMSMILLTVPIFAPLVQQLGFDLIWFGILVVVVTEISLITPPIGLNVFVLKGVVRDVSVSTIFKGVTPFWCADIIRLILLTSIPALSLFLPSLM